MALQSTLPAHPARGQAEGGDIGGILPAGDDTIA